MNSYDSKPLVYIGMIQSLEKIENADFLENATVVCGSGGKWKGVVVKNDFKVYDKCIVFLPDSLLPKESQYEFMKKHNYRVKMCRFRGSPSEVLIMKTDLIEQIGTDVTYLFGVSKYNKPVPSHLQGKALGYFPSFIPKTDEPNYQSVPDMVDALVGKPFYITEKADGSSTTAYKYKGHFGVCSRNFELERNEENGYWKVAITHNLEELLPEGIALQWETCGPNIQSNPMGLQEIEGFAFSAYNIEEKRYLLFTEYCELLIKINFPTVILKGVSNSFCKQNIEKLSEGKYKNGNEIEGVVIRSQENFYGHKPISFKVINLNYE